MGKDIRNMVLIRVPMAMVVVIAMAAAVWAILNLEAGATRDTVFIVFWSTAIGMPGLSYLLYFLFDK